MDGWIKIHRKILDNPIVCRDCEHIAVWNYLLLNASHKDRQVFFNGEKIVLKAGQLITGRDKIAKVTEKEISSSKVQRILKLFENEQLIEQQTCNKNRLITIVNWNEYQDNTQESEQQNEQQLNNKRTTTEQQLNTNKNIKNVRIKDIKESTTSSTKEKAKRFSPPTLEEVKNYCLERKNAVEPQRFFDFYTAKDWYIGKNKMKDWKAAVRTWENKDKAELKQKQGSFSQREYSDEALKSVLVNFED